MADWMAELPRAAQALPLHRLLLPGTHFSGAYQLTRSSLTRQPRAWRALRWLPPVRDWFARWTLTQQGDLYAQLERGARVLDLRVAYDRRAARYYLASGGLACVEAHAALRQVARFVRQHRGEVVLLRVGADPKHAAHTDLSRFLELACAQLDGLLVPRTRPLSDLTIARLSKSNHRVLLFSAATSVLAEVWGLPWLEARRGDTLAAQHAYLCEFLQTHAALASDGQRLLHLPLALNHGGSANPLDEPDHSLRERAQRLHTPMYAWLADARVDQINVVTTDFLDDRLVQWVIDRNLARVD